MKVMAKDFLRLRLSCTAPGCRQERPQLGTLYKWKLLAYTNRMIRSFRNKELANLWAGSRSKIDSRMHDRLLARLDVLNAAAKPDDMDVSGWDFHMLRGKPQRFTVHVNGPWCLTFEFDQGDAWRVDFEQYH